MKQTRRANHSKTALNAVGRRAESLLRFPVGTLSEEPHLELSGRRRFLLEGCCELLCCEEDTVTVQTSDGNIRIQGRELCVITLSDEGLLLTGQLLSLEFFD